MKPLLTPGEVGQIIKRPVRSVYTLVKAGKLKAVQDGRLLRFRQEDLEAYISDHLTQPPSTWTNGSGEPKEGLRVNPGQKPGVLFEI